MQKRIIHSYYIFLLFFFCYQLFKLSFTAYLLLKYLEGNVKNFFIYMNLNKKVVLKIIKQHKDLILYHWNCFSISNFYVFRYKKKIACKSIIPYWFNRNFYTFIKKLKTSFFLKHTLQNKCYSLCLFSKYELFNTKSQFFSSFSTFKTSKHFEHEINVH